MPAVSIIIPLYNAADTLSFCLSSILAQSFTDWELLLIDDGSTDSSLSVCRDFEGRDSRIKAWTQPHDGVSAARNLGLDRMSGQYVCFIDADDRVEPDYLEQLYRFRTHDLAVCGYFTDHLGADGTSCRQNRFLPVELDLRSLADKTPLVPLFTSGMIQFCWNKLLHARIIRDHQLRFVPIPVNEDYRFMLDYLAHCQSIRSIPVPLYHWTRRSGKKTAISLFPPHLASCYLDAHTETIRYFQDRKVAGEILFPSYYWVILKHLDRIGSDPDIRGRLQSLVAHPLVREAFRYHKSSSVKEAFLVFLLRHRFYNLFSSIRKWLLDCKK